MKKIFLITTSIIGVLSIILCITLGIIIYTQPSKPPVIHPLLPPYETTTDTIVKNHKPIRFDEDTKEYWAARTDEGGEVFSTYKETLKEFAQEISEHTETAVLVKVLDKEAFEKEIEEYRRPH